MRHDSLWDMQHETSQIEEGPRLSTPRAAAEAQALPAFPIPHALHGKKKQVWSLRGCSTVPCCGERSGRASHEHPSSEGAEARQQPALGTAVCCTSWKNHRQRLCEASELKRCQEPAARGCSLPINVDGRSCGDTIFLQAPACPAAYFMPPR